MTRKFDAYVCYDFQGNNDYVTNTVLPALEESRDPPLNLCNHTRDFEPGVQIIDNIRSAIKNSKSAIIIMSQDFVDSPWCTREFEECCIENLKDPGFKLFVVLMQPRNTLTNVRQYEEHMKKFLHSDKVLNKDDPKLFEKISHYLSRYAKKPKRKTLLQLLRKKQNDPEILDVSEFSTENKTEINVQRNISSETIEIFEDEFQNKTLQNDSQLEHLENADLPQGMAIVQVHAVDFQDDDPLLSQEKVSGRDIEWLELDESRGQGNRLQRHASLDKKQDISEAEVEVTGVPNLLEVEVRQKENDSDTLIGHKTIHSTLANADDGDDRVGSFITNDRKLIELRNEKTRSRPYDAFVSFHHSGPHRDFVFDRILSELEEIQDPPFRLYIHDRDFDLAEDIMWNIETAIRQSNSAIIVMSQGYVDSKWCRVELRECFLESAADSAFQIFVILMQPMESLVNKSIYMKKFFGQTTCASHTDTRLFTKLGKGLKEIKE